LEELGRKYGDFVEIAGMTPHGAALRIDLTPGRKVAKRRRDK